MNQTKINIKMKSSNLLETFDSLKEVIDELGNGWDVTVEIDYETTNDQVSIKPEPPVSSSRKKKKKSEKPSMISPRVYTSHDFDLQTDLSGIVPDPSIPAPWESLD